MAKTKEFLKTAINEAILETAFCPDLDLNEQYGVSLKPKFDTACWTWQPPHRIYVGEQALDKAKSGLSDNSLLEYVASFVYHEMAHMTYTERDLKKVNADLRALKIAFSLFNLFEDARIENFWRVVTGRAFAWVDFEPAPELEAYKPKPVEEGKVAEAANPTTIFFRIIQLDGKEAFNYDKSIVEAMLEEGTDEFALQDLYTEVYSFYTRALVAKTSTDLYPLLEEWVKRFPEYSKPEGGEAGGSDGLSISLDLAEGVKSFADFDADSEELKPSGPREVEDPVGTVVIDSISGRGEGMLAGSSLIGLNKDRVSKITQQIAKLLQGKAHNVQTTAPSRRVSGRHFAVGRPFYQKKEVIGKVHKKISLIVDCSGSMSGDPMNEGRLLVSCFNELARRGAVSGNLILSAGSGSTADWLSLKLPVPDSTIERIHGYGGSECLEYTMKGNLKTLKASDIVMVYTDANITDAPVNKASLHAKGIYTYGLYVGSPAHSNREMAKYFDKAIIRDTVENLVDAMLVAKLTM